MKKFLLIGGALILNFLLFAVSVAFYAKEEPGKVAEDTTNIPVILFVFGCYLLPWYAVNKNKLSKGMNILTVGLFSWSFLFLWTLLSITGGFFSGFLNFLSFFGSFLAPVGFYHIMRWKEEKIQESLKDKRAKEQNEKVVSKEEKEKVQGLSSFDTVQALIQSIQDPEVNEKGQEILVLLKNILDNPHTLDVEETHILNRLMTTDLVHLLQAYLLLNEEKQEEIEQDILHNLDIITRYLRSILDGVSNEHLKEIKTSMHLIEQRYKK